MTISIRSRSLLPRLAVGSVVLFALGCPPETAAFRATFDTAADFYNRFDYGFSGLDPHSGDNGVPPITHFHGDHNESCESPYTSRDVHYTDDYSELFWHCAPGGDPTKGHIMTAVDTLGYNIAWFSPKPTFTNVSKVCWDVNQTAMSHRKWKQVLFVGADDAKRYPAGSVSADSRAVARGSGGFDLGYTSPDFRQGVAPSTGIDPKGGTLAGLKNLGGTFRWFQNQDTWTPGDVGWSPAFGTDDKATRYKNCIFNQPNNTVGIVQQVPLVDDNQGAKDGVRYYSIAGQIPQHPVRVVFEDDNYDPIKDERYNPEALTWHWDNIEVYTNPAAKQ